MAAFAFDSIAVTPIQVSPGSNCAVCAGVADMTAFCRQIGWLHWTVYGGAGGLDRCPHTSFADPDRPLKIPEIDSSSTYSFGSTACGDEYVYDTAGRAGMLAHESLRIFWIGTVADTMNWIFHELRHKRTPEFDYNRWGKDR
jgi:hypothetical protein